MQDAGDLRCRRLRHETIPSGSGKITYQENDTPNSQNTKPMIRKETTIYYKRSQGIPLKHTFKTKKDASAFIRDLQRFDAQCRWSYEPFE